jgi:hypothetical protein
VKLLIPLFHVIAALASGAETEPAAGGDLRIPPIVEWVRASPSGIQDRVGDAIAKGPAAVEELARKIHAEKGVDADGRDMTANFYACFTDDRRIDEVAENRLYQRKAVEAWLGQFPDSPYAKLAAGVFWTDYAWDLPGYNEAINISAARMKTFKSRLKMGRDWLMEARELEDVTPAWSLSMITSYRGEDGGREKFEELATAYFEKFPECESRTIILSMAPHWGAKPGEWEPWLRDKIKDLPADVQARAYARTLIQITGFWYYGKSRREEMIKPVTIDRELLRKGLVSLTQKYPASVWVNGGDALVSSYLLADRDRTRAALKRANGRLDLRSWYQESVYDSVVEWLDKP